MGVSTGIAVARGVRIGAAAEEIGVINGRSALATGAITEARTVATGAIALTTGARAAVCLMRSRRAAGSPSSKAPAFPTRVFPSQVVKVLSVLMTEPRLFAESPESDGTCPGESPDKVAPARV